MLSEHTSLNAENPAALLWARNEQLARELQVREEFLAGVSHELRTPLNAILGIAELLQDGHYGQLTEHQQSPVAMIVRNSYHLLALINDLLDLAKIEAGREELELAPVMPGDLCRNALEIVQASATTAQVQLREHWPRTMPSIQGDGRRLLQILVNLLGNGVKFTPEGGEVGLEYCLDSDGTARFCVWDTGIGITPAQQERLFRSFAQVETALSRRTPGTGLGLALVARLTRMHGGSVALASAPGSGSRFSIALPAHGLVPAGPAVLAPPASPTVLVIDDYGPTAALTAAQLERAGFACTGAGSVAAANALAAEQPPLAAVVTPPMGDHQGAATLRELRAGPLAATPLVLVGAVALHDSAARAQAGGADAYLTHPLASGTLVAVLHELLRNRAH